MNVIRVIFGTNGDQGVLPILYQVIGGNESRFVVQVDIDLLYDYLFPTIEFNGARMTLEYLTEEEIRDQIIRLLNGEFYPQRALKYPIHR